MAPISFTKPPIPPKKALRLNAAYTIAKQQCAELKEVRPSAHPKMPQCDTFDDDLNLVY
jgi:hypothetical protein